MTPLACAGEQRREVVRQHTRLNGFDYLEVGTDRRILSVHFLGKAPVSLEPSNLVIEGGRRIRDIKVVRVTLNRTAMPGLDDTMEVVTDREGDSSDVRSQSGRARRAGCRASASVVRSALRPRRLHVQGRLPQRSRLQAGPGVPAGTPRRARDQLPRQGLRELPAADAGSPGAGDAGVARTPRAGPRHRPCRGAGLRRRSPELLPGRRRDRGVYRDSAAAHLRATACAACGLRAARGLQREDVGVCADRWRGHARACATSGSSRRFRTWGRWRNRPSWNSWRPAGTKSSSRSPIGDIKLYPGEHEIHFYTWGDQECCLSRGSTTATLIGRWIEEPSPSEPPCDPPKGEPAAKSMKPQAAPPGVADGPQLHLKPRRRADLRGGHRPEDRLTGRRRSDAPPSRAPDRRRACPGPARSRAGA